MVRRRTAALFAAAVAVVLLTGCQVATVSTPYARQLTGVKTCLQREGYAVHGLSSWVLPISGLPQPLQSLNVPFLSKPLLWPLLIVDWNQPRGVRHPSIDIEFLSTIAKARIEASHERRLGKHVQRIANVVHDREPGDDAVAAAIAECIQPSSSKQLPRVPIAVEAQGPLARELLRVFARNVREEVTRVACSERMIRGAKTLCAVTLLDGSCQPWQIVKTQRGRVEAAVVTPWTCTIVMGTRPSGLNGR